MNHFDIYPLSANRGEIVTIRIELHHAFRTAPEVQGPEGRIFCVERKFKTSSKTSAVNAFHMHRALCQDIRTEMSWSRDIAFTTRQYRFLTKLARRIVLDSYLTNAGYHANGSSSNCTAREFRKIGSQSWEPVNQQFFVFAITFDGTNFGYFQICD